ncbi:MAG: tRNA threonylcarbamoyladenosine dehydratase [Bacteroidales bacterium]|nr:tRNA threonylcarbamoyladenosine dehydratase [Bacteroidales bacterium]MDY6348129.1 tRNA threonylcarbamoyladenosine dehydratase [Bacteroidales bacterium]
MNICSTTDTSGIFTRTNLLLGDAAMEKISAARVIVFGVGGVGSWCAESLVRSGVRRITIVDADTVAPSNVNRQAQATCATVGRPKVSVLKERLLEINPNAEVEDLMEVYTSENADSFSIDSYDYVIDAIDSLSHKAHLILNATRSGATLFSSMGAALKIDPQLVRVGEFWKVIGCPLARALRKKFKHDKTYPTKKFLCVYSPELLQNHGVQQAGEVLPQGIHKPVANGTVSHVTAIFGFTLAGLVIQDLVEQLVK